MMKRTFAVLAGLFCTFVATIQSATLQRLPGSAHPYRFSVSPSAAPLVVEASTDLVNWTQLSTIAASGSATVVTDSQSATFAKRFYRTRTQVPALSDLTQLPNTVFMAGEGFNTLQYAPNGKIGFIVWRGQD